MHTFSPTGSTWDASAHEHELASADVMTFAVTALLCEHVTVNPAGNEASEKGAHIVETRGASRYVSAPAFILPTRERVHHARSRRSRCRDTGVHDPDPGVHDAAIYVFTMRRSRRSRWGDFRTSVSVSIS